MTLLVGTAVAALALAVVPAIADAATDPSGTVVTDPLPSTRTTGRSAVVSDEVGWLESDGTTATAYTNASYAKHDVDSPTELLSGAYLSASGGQAVAFNPDTNVLSAVSLTTGHAVAGSTSDLLSTYDPPYLAGTTGTAWVLSASTLDTFTQTTILRPIAGGADVVVPAPGGDVIGREVLAAGVAGVLVKDTVQDPDTFALSYDVGLIKADGSSTSLATAVPDATQFFGGAVSSTHVAWVTDTGIQLYAKTGGAPVVIPVSGMDIGSLALSKGTVFWFDYTTFIARMADSSGVAKTLVAPLSGYELDAPRASTLQDGTPAGLVTTPSSDNDGGSLTWYSYASTGAAAHLSGGFEDLTLDTAAQTAGQAFGQYAADASTVKSDYRTQPMFVRSIGGSPLAYGTSAALLSRASDFSFTSRLYRGSRFGEGYGFSGLRGAVATWPSPTATSQELTLVDEGTRTAGVPIGRTVSVSQSGPYTAFVRAVGAGGVALPDGTIVATLPAGLAHVVQDGPRVAYSTSDGALYLRDVTKPLAAGTNPRQLLGACLTPTIDCWRDYAISGGRLAVTTIKDGQPEGGVRLFDVTTGAPTTLAQVTGAQAVALRGDVLTYIELVPNPNPDLDATTTIKFVDLGAGTPAPSSSTIVDTPAPGYSSRGYVGLDGHDVWWASATQLKTAPIPADVDSDSAPRLLGSTGATELYRTGGALSAPWTPTFDLDQPLTSSWTLTITKGATTVKAFTGDATVGIRGISWDGKDTGGTLVPNGTYTWTLTGSNADGALVSSLGSGDATGTLSVSTPVLSKTVLKAVPATIVYGGSAKLTASLARAGGGTPAGQAVDFYGRAKGASAWTKLGTGSTDASGLASLTVKPSANWQYYASHPISAALLPSSSTTVGVNVAFKVSTTWKSSKVKRGKTVLLTGAVGPTVAGSVLVQRKSGTRWVTAASATLKSGRFSVKVKVPKKKGYVTYRVLKTADSGHLAGLSATKRIKVV